MRLIFESFVMTCVIAMILIAIVTAISAVILYGGAGTYAAILFALVWFCTYLDMRTDI